MSEEFNAVDAALLGFPPSLGNSQLLVQQRNVAALLHPRSPVERLLVDHNTGSGKTLLMLRPSEDRDLSEGVRVRVADPLVRLLRQPDPVEAARNP